MLVLAALAFVGAAESARAQNNRQQTARPAAVESRDAGAAAPVAPAPPAGPLGAARAALRAGRYDEAERAFRDAARGRERGAALVGVARVQIETGRYEDAARTASDAVRAGARTAGETARAEALLARGRLEDAERALRAATTDATAWRARVWLGRVLDRTGRRDDARDVWMELVEAYNDDRIPATDGEGLAYVGMAARGLGSFQDANDAFQQAARALPGDVETQLEWAEMFLEKYDAGHAEECVRDAIAVNPKHPRALALLARIRLEQSLEFAAARDACDAAIAVNPSLVLCHVTRAAMAMKDMSLDEADRHLDAALAVDPNDLEALSVRAAVRFLADDRAGLARARQEVLRRNPRYSRLFSIIGEHAEWEHRYDEIVAMMREAIRLDPEDALARAKLGLNLLRLGEETEGLVELRAAWERDRFNVQVFNTLNLYDEVIGRYYETVEPGRGGNPRWLRVRYPRAERAVLERYVPQTLDRAWRDMVRRYGFTPRGPIALELYGHSEHFSVRTSGLPRLGVQGVCFGRVVTALSPGGGPFNWGQITWHELGHVFAIQLSRARVPRWFTEGLSEYETAIAEPHWQREDDAALAQALRSGRVPAIASLNRAFTHVRSPEEVLVGYYASYRAVRFIVEQFGFARVPEMLAAWGRGLSTVEVIQRVLRVTPDELDRRFRETEHARLARYDRDFSVDFAAHRDLDARRSAARARPNDADARAALAVALVVAGEARHARTEADAAIRIQASNPVARFVLARLAAASDDVRGAAGHLRAILDSGIDGYEVRLFGARLAIRSRDAGAARRELEAATRIDADRIEAWQGLLELVENDPPARLEVLRRLAQIDQHDREVQRELLAALERASLWDEARAVASRGLYLDPHSAEHHRVLGVSLERAGRARLRDALFELDTALLASPERPAPIHVARARVLLATGRRSEARTAAEEALRLDPANAEARALVERTRSGR
ncbi:MAG: tetratricopeptide repeat protein [Deltaproteobacteria bacterium]|nr:tetratricopeptide repeat protein [Deltaproteobacteria bacterium]